MRGGKPAIALRSRWVMLSEGLGWIENGQRVSLRHNFTAPLNRWGFFAYPGRVARNVRLLRL